MKEIDKFLEKAEGFFNEWFKDYPETGKRYFAAFEEYMNKE